MGKFIIHATDTGFVFHLKAANAQTIATSEVYQRKPSCKKGIASVVKNAPIAYLEDQTIEGFSSKHNPKFEVYMDKAGEYRFRLKAANGQIIASSEGYVTKESCENGIQSVRENAPIASIVEEE